MFKVFSNTLQSKTFKSALFLMGCLLCTEALATIFSVAPTDRSKIYLGMVFGGSVGGIQLSGDSNNTLSLMFARFNYIILTVGVLVISYIGVSSTINTAREGEALGKKMSLWVPMRAMLGTLLMVPSPASGYSVVQMTVLWIVLNGIGAANSVWSVVLTQLQQGVGIVSSASVKIAGVNFPGDLDALVQAAMLSSTCMYTLNDKMPELKSMPGKFKDYGGVVKIFTSPNSNVVQDNGTATTQPSKLTQTATINVGLEGAPPPYNTLCGSFTITTELYDNDSRNTFNKATAQQRTAVKVAALRSVFSALDPAARLITQSLTTTSGRLDPRFYIPPAPGYYLTAKQAYASTIAQLYQGVHLSPSSLDNDWEQGIGGRKSDDTAQTQGTNLKNTNDITKVQSYGWIHAGSYYYSLIKSSLKAPDSDSIKIPDSKYVPVKTDLDNTTHLPTTTAGSWPTKSGDGNNTGLTGNEGLLTGLTNLETTKLNTYLQAMDDYYTQDANNDSLSGQGTLIGGNASTGNKILNIMIRPIRSLQNSVVEGMQTFVEGNGQDPLASLHQFGWGLMIAAEIASIGAMIASFGISLAGSTGSCMSPLPWTIDTLLSQIFPLLIAMFAMLWTGGATLNIYLPMVPYLIFTTAAFSWILAVIEAVVGAPIVALALAHPSGEELGKVGTPLLLLANIFLRPMLMLFGFVLGAGLLRAGIALINFGFLPAINGSTTPTLFSVVAVLMMYIMLIMAIVNKSFSLIYLLPNQIMRWLGGPTETSDPSDMVKEAKGGFDTGAKTGQAAVNEGGNQAKSATSDAKEKGKEQHKAFHGEESAQKSLPKGLSRENKSAGGGGMPPESPPNSGGSGAINNKQ